MLAIIFEKQKNRKLVKESMKRINSILSALE